MRNLRIGQQLVVGLGSIMLFVLVLGAAAWWQTNILWEETQGLYDHPLAVRRALGELKADILAMRIGLKDILVTEGTREKEAIIQTIVVHDAHVLAQFAVLKDRYLGPGLDVESAYNEYGRWQSIRDEVIHLIREGKPAEALLRMSPGGVGAAQADVVFKHIQKISDFSVERGDKFYHNAQERRDTLHLQLGGLISIIFLLSLGISYALLRQIREPLKELTTATQLYQQGKLDARSRYVSGNEFGELSASFNSLASAMQAEMRGKEDAAHIAAVMLQEEELHGFCRELLKALMEHTASQIGAVYFLNETKTEFVNFDSVGMGTGGRVSFSATGREGEFGMALATRRVQRISDIPADTRFVFGTASGDFHPREILTIPILTGREVVAMLSLAGIRDYTPAALRLVDDVLSTLTARLNGVLVFENVKMFSEKLEHQNRELEAQKKELGAQTDELNQQNVELSMQKNQLEQANRLKTSFLSNMSHELRTPLNSVIALSGVLNRRLGKNIPAEEYGYIEVIERNGKHLLALINDILDLSRVEAGHTDVHLSRFHVRELVGEVVAMLEPSAQEKRTAIRNSVPIELEPVVSDVSLCRHILQNLVANAVKFTEQGGVEITASQTDAYFRIRVTDTGIGIASDKLSAIFDEFRQADESTSRKYGGTGLGLAIARKYATLLHGHIDVTSTLGQGSSFTLNLPVIPAVFTHKAGTEDYVAAPRSVIPASFPSGQGKCVLLVEDSEPTIVQMKDILIEQGYRILVARSGREALDQIAVTLPDAMILDLMMPEVDGLEVLRLIREQERTMQLPVLILTAKHVTKEELSFLTSNHVRQLIQKGDVGKSQLLAAVAAMVAPPLRSDPVRRRRNLQQPAGRPTLLVVEDNADNMRTVKALLQDDYELLEAFDGRSAVAQTLKHKPDLILMDIALPLLDGIAAMETIRSNEDLRQIPVIALTASAMKGDREEILNKGFDAYVSKPIDAEVLARTIKEVLGGNGEN